MDGGLMYHLMHLKNPRNYGILGFSSGARSPPSPQGFRFRGLGFRVSAFGVYYHYLGFGGGSFG